MIMVKLMIFRHYFTKILSHSNGWISSIYFSIKIICRKQFATIILFSTKMVCLTSWTSCIVIEASRKN